MLHALTSASAARASAVSCAWIALLYFSARASGQETIGVHGSDSMLILNRELAAEYADVDPSVRVSVLGGGSEAGIAALMAGETDIAASSRPMKETELQAFEKRTGARPQEIVVALDGLAVYIHEYNPISTLTLPQLAGIMAGEVRNWREVGGLDLPIEIYNRDKNSGTRSFMQEHVLGDKTFSRLAREVSTTARLTANVSCNPNAIGYGGVAYARGARIIRLAAGPGQVGVWPSEENVAAGKYPLWRSLYYYLNPAAMDAHHRAFVDWLLGPDGQHVVKLVGYYRAPGADRAIPVEASHLRAAEEPLRLTPINMQGHGFVLSVALSDGARPGHKQVAVRFNPAGASIERIRSVTLRLGGDADVPQTLDADLALRFSLRSALVGSTSVFLAEAAAPGAGAVYAVALDDFCSVD